MDPLCKEKLTEADRYCRALVEALNVAYDAASAAEQQGIANALVNAERTGDVLKHLLREGGR